MTHHNESRSKRWLAYVPRHSVVRYGVSQKSCRRASPPRHWSYQPSGINGGVVSLREKRCSVKKLKLTILIVIAVIRWKRKTQHARHAEGDGLGFSSFVALHHRRLARRQRVQTTRERLRHDLSIPRRKHSVRGIRTHGRWTYNPQLIAEQVKQLYADPYIKSRKGVFEYILGGLTDVFAKLLEVRVFDEAIKIYLC